MNTPNPDESLPRGIRLGYGLGSVTTGAFGTVPGLMLLPYLTDTLGIAAGVAGILVFAPKAWDVLLNPVVGRISDASGDPRGPRRGFLLRGGLPLALGFVLLFAGPPLGSRLLDGLWVLVMFLLCATAYAFFQVPYMSMPAEITGSYHERTRLMSWRVAILAFTILFTGAGAPAIRDALGGRDGYRAMASVVAALIAIGVLGVYRGTRSAPVGAVAPGSTDLRGYLRPITTDREFRLLMVVFVVQALAASTMLASVDYVARWVIGDTGAATLLFVCFVGPALLLTPAWAGLGQRIGKARGHLLASLVWVLATGLLLTVTVAPTWSVYAAAALTGVGYSGMQLFPMAMLPDVAAAGSARAGVNRSGVYTGLWTAGETLGLALGPGLYALVLASGGYLSSTASAGTAAAGPDQPSSAITAIVLGFSLIPAILVAVSMIPLARSRSHAPAGTAPV